MPLVTWAFLAFLSGILAAFSEHAIAWCVPAIIVWYVAWSHSIPIGMACCAVGLAGVIAGWTGERPKPAYLREPRASSFWQHQHDRANDAVERVFREHAPMAKALLIADQSEIPREVKNQYADAGIIHMLSISGLHVGIVAVAIELAAQLVRLPVVAAKLVAVGTIALYVAVLGFPPPAVRSGVMLGAATIATIIQRPTSRWAVLTLGAAIPLIQPGTALNLGYQLSVAGMAGLFASASLVRRTIQGRLRGWRFAIVKGLLASTVSTLATAPLVAWTFGRLSLIGPVTNLLADPVITLAQPMLFLALLLAPILPAAQFVADATVPLLTVFDTIAARAAAVPGAALQIEPSPLTTIAATGASVAICMACVARFPARPLIAAGAAVAVLCWSG